MVHSRQRLSIDDLPVALFTYSVDSARFTSVNAKFAKTLGYGPADILALGSLTDIIPEDQREQVREMIRRRQSGDDREVRYTTKVRCRDGTVLDAEIHSSIAEIDGERVVVGVAVDVTNQTASHGHLRAQIAHEFNNVLMGIQSVTEAIRRRAGDDPALLRFTDVITASLKRGKRLTKDVFRFGQPAQLTLRPVDVRALFRQTADEIRPLPGGRIQVEFVCADPLFVHGDAGQLAQVLVNLALNARDAMEATGGTLTLEARPAIEGEIASADRFVHISVRDTGTGISADDLSYVFEPLFTTKNRGTGLGLSVAYQVIAAHGGEITVESKPGEGTAFHLLIPSDAPAEEADEEPSQAALEPLPESLRVLIVDDDDAVATGLRWLLEAAGMDAHVVRTGAEVLPAIETFRPDVVVLDLSLPDEDGRTVYERIAAQSAVPVVFSSGHVSDAELPELLGLARTRFLMKPYPTDALVNAIRELVGGRRE